MKPFHGWALFALLRANKLDAASGDQKLLWTMRVPGEWHLRMQRGRAWREFWFVREGDFVLPFQYITSDDSDQTRLQDAVDMLLVLPATNKFPRVSRCTPGQ